MAADAVSWKDLLARPTGKPDAHIAYGAGLQQFVELWLPKSTGPHHVGLLVLGG